MGGGGRLRLNAEVKFKYAGELIKEIQLNTPDGDQRWKLSYRDDDPRFIEKVVRTVDTELGTQALFFEQTTSYRYDERSRIDEIANTISVKNAEGEGTETSETFDLRWDGESGRLTRVTQTEEVPLIKQGPASDWCWDNDYYNDGACDSSCPQRDPDCDVDAPEPVAPGSRETEVRRSTSLYSMGYDENGRLEKLEAPGGLTYEVDYDGDDRIQEIEARGDDSSLLVEYTYEAGEVRGHSLSPALPHGRFFDLLGDAFGTLPAEISLDVIEMLSPGSAEVPQEGPSASGF